MECCLIDREYYPLAMAAEILECSEDDLIHFAATQKIEVHVLADKYISVRHYKDGSDKYIFLPSVALVSHEYFSSLEISNVHPLLMLIIPSTENNNELFNVFPPFLDGMGEEIELSDFVILHGELMKIKKPVEQNAISDVKGAYVYDAQDSYMSKELLILNEASQKFWGNADPKEKDTHLKRDVVIKHLIDKGFSEIKAKTGASIIRPVWAAQGRRSTD